MTEALIRAWRARTDRAVAWSSGQDPEPVLEALAMWVAVAVVGSASRVAPPERRALRKVGQRALLQLGGPLKIAGGDTDEDEDARDALRLAAAIAREGLALLDRDHPPHDGEPSDDPSSPPSRALGILIPPDEVVRMLRGELDGFAAGSLAWKIRRSRTARAELEMLLAVADASPLDHSGGESAAPRSRRLALAASEAAPVLDPARGRPLSTHPEAGAELVLFSEAHEAPGARKLAVYAESPEPIRLVAPELRTEDVREGYWVGSLHAGVTRIAATLQIGDRSYPWQLEVPDAK